MRELRSKVMVVMIVWSIVLRIVLVVAIAVMVMTIATADERVYIFILSSLRFHATLLKMIEL
jgi:hypothetical protein